MEKKEKPSLLNSALLVLGRKFASSIVLPIQYRLEQLARLNPLHKENTYKLLFNRYINKIKVESKIESFKVSSVFDKFRDKLLKKAEQIEKEKNIKKEKINAINKDVYLSKDGFALHSMIQEKEYDKILLSLNNKSLPYNANTLTQVNKLGNNAVDELFIIYNDLKNKYDDYKKNNIRKVDYVSQIKNKEFELDKLSLIIKTALTKGGYLTLPKFLENHQFPKTELSIYKNNEVIEAKYSNILAKNMKELLVDDSTNIYFKNYTLTKLSQKYIDANNNYHTLNDNEKLKALFNMLEYHNFYDSNIYNKEGDIIFKQPSDIKNAEYKILSKDGEYINAKTNNFELFAIAELSKLSKLSEVSNEMIELLKDKIHNRIEKIFSSGYMTENVENMSKTNMQKNTNYVKEKVAKMRESFECYKEQISQLDPIEKIKIITEENNNVLHNLAILSMTKTIEFLVENGIAKGVKECNADGKTYTDILNESTLQITNNILAKENTSVDDFSSKIVDTSDISLSDDNPLINDNDIIELQDDYQPTTSGSENLKIETSPFGKKLQEMTKNEDEIKKTPKLF